VIRIVINQCLKLKFKSHPSRTSWRYQHTTAVLVTTSLGCKGDILQTWRVAANMLNESSWIHNKGWPYSLWFGCRANKSWRWQSARI
jgi:hypothetical protein